MTWPVELSELAYEAAIVPERWQSFLDQGAQAVGAKGGTLFGVDGMSSDSIISHSLHDPWRAILDEGWASRNPLPERAILKRKPGFMHDLEVLPQAERTDMAWFAEFTPRWDLGPSLGTVLQVPNGKQLIMTFERASAAPAYTRADAEQFDLLRPSIARAVSLSAHLAFQQFQTTVQLLNGLGLPGAVVNSSGRLLSCNSSFDALVPDLFMDHRSGVRLRTPSADALLRETLERLAPDLWSGTVASIPVPRGSDGEAPAIVHVLPIRGVAQDILFGATGLLLVDRLGDRPGPSDVILRGLFDLTPAEAKVALALLQNHGQHKQVATSLGVSPETVKSHSKAIYQKTGLTGVIELASVLGGLLPTEADVPEAQRPLR